MKTPEEIYKACPKLSNIADRLADSEAEATERNKEYRLKGSQKKKFPEHFRITKIYTSHWEEVPGIAKQGRQAFEKSITSIIDTRDPSALMVEVYGGKRKTPNSDSYVCYLSSDPEIQKKIENPEASDFGGLGSELALLKNQVTEITKNGNTSPAGDSSLAIQLKEMQHKFE